MAEMAAVIALATDGKSPWWIVLAAALVPLGAGTLVLVREIKAWRTGGRAEVLTREQSLMRDLDTQRAAATKEAADLFERAKGELTRRDESIKRLEERVNVLEAEELEARRVLWRWQDIARAWKDRTHGLRHELLNLLTLLNAQRRSEGLPERDVPPPLPDLDKIV